MELCISRALSSVPHHTSFAAAAAPLALIRERRSLSSEPRSEAEMNYYSFLSGVVYCVLKKGKESLSEEGYGSEICVELLVENVVFLWNCGWSVKSLEHPQWTGSRLYSRNHHLVRAAASDEASTSINSESEVADTGVVAVEESPAEKRSFFYNKVEESAADRPSLSYEVKESATEKEIRKDEPLSGEKSELFELLEQYNIKLDSVDPTVLIYGSTSLFALWVASAVVGAIDAIPLLPKVLELVGLGYSVWFSYRYLIFKVDMQILPVVQHYLLFLDRLTNNFNFIPFSTLGAVLDMVVDRVSTNSLLVILSQYYSPGLFFLAFLGLDISSHWIQMYRLLSLKHSSVICHSTFLSGKASHKDVKDSNYWLLKTYYGNRIFMAYCCIAAEVFYLILYFIANNQSNSLIDVMINAVRHNSLVRFPLILSMIGWATKQIINVIQIKTSADACVLYDINRKQKP
ncbi:hypothetical protein Syun_015451 [Stephania yunnanensis]|uniref:Cyanobacterial aminoacyl-tRNA synthetase CAAD domain-containing protein n=1 Tax=Stephania yunnanensis TaxID=152371 RepID=A0AAP0PCU3_9MAGN